MASSASNSPQSSADASEDPRGPQEGRGNSPLTRSKEAFISHWGEMGSSWGVPRSMAEMHALLFIEGRPMNTDEIMERLQVSRGNVSTTLRQLADWGIVTRTRLRGDRKDHFEAEQDVWNLLSLIVRARKRRELEPLLAALDDARTLAAARHALHALADSRNPHQSETLGQPQSRAVVTCDLVPVVTCDLVPRRSNLHVDLTVDLQL